MILVQIPAKRADIITIIIVITAARHITLALRLTVPIARFVLVQALVLPEPVQHILVQIPAGRVRMLIIYMIMPIIAVHTVPAEIVRRAAHVL